ncbi:MAG: winged helix-turn-helix domain-containing protein [Fibrobacterota bacterium]
MAEGTSIINQTNFDLSGAIWLCSEGKQVLNKKHLRLLEAIDTTGSISAAAKSLPMSYKAAWDAVDSLNNLSRDPLITTSTGGRAGGGARLTDYGRQMVSLLSALQKAYTQFIQLLPENIPGDSCDHTGLSV